VILFGKLDHELLEPNRPSAAWRFALKNGGRIEANLEGRVTDVSKKNVADRSK